MQVLLPQTLKPDSRDGPRSLLTPGTLYADKEGHQARQLVQLWITLLEQQQDITSILRHPFHHRLVTLLSFSHHCTLASQHAVLISSTTCMDPLLAVWISSW